jgi:hypothetical protein
VLLLRKSADKRPEARGATPDSEHIAVTRSSKGFQPINRIIRNALASSVAALHACALLLPLTCGTAAAEQPLSGTVRWAEGAANCTLRTAEDGHTYYGLSLGDFDITLAVDKQELEKVPHRAVPMLAVLLSFHYRGKGQLKIQQDKFALQFLKHRKTVQPSLDPDETLTSLNQSIDDVTDEYERHEIRKHPEQKEKKEAELQMHVKDYQEMMDFISTRALHSTTLDATNSSVSGWVFFSTKSRWIGPWHRPEAFVLLLPIEKLIVEFPFELPPRAGHPQLRRRGADKSD